MSNFLQKAQNNDNASGILIENGLYATSVHCSYYRCFQYMMHLQKHSFTTNVREDWSQGSHNDLINRVSREMRVKDAVASVNFNNDILKLKKLRNKADYEEPMFDAGTSREAQRMATGIVQLFQRVFGK